MLRVVLAASLALASAFVPPSSLQTVQRVAVSPGSNYPTTKNIQTQSNGFGTFISAFQGLGKNDKSKYGVPVFLPSGNINPAYLAAERKAMALQKKKNIAGTAAKMN